MVGGRCENAGDVLYRLGYYPKAAETLEAGLRLDPTHAPGFFVLGNCYFRTNDPAAACAAYEAALARCPDYPDALSNLRLARQALAGSQQAA